MKRQPNISNNDPSRIIRKPVHVALASLKILALSLLLGLIYSTIRPHAAAAMTPNDIPDDIRPQIVSYNNGCASNPNKYQLLSWVSDGASQRNDVAITVPYGTRYVPLKFNTGVFLCYTLVNVNGYDYRPVGLPQDGTPNGSANLRQNYTYVASSGVTPFGILGPSPNVCGQSGPNGCMLTIGYNSGTRYWLGGGGIDFQYDAQRNLTSSVKIYVTVNYQGVNHYASGSYACASGGAPTTGPPPNSCPLASFSFPIEINVQPPVTVQTHIFKVDSVGNYLGEVTGVTLETCSANGNSSQSRSGGFVYFNVASREGYCIRITGTDPGAVNGFSGPFVRPWSEGYQGCGGFGGPPYSGHCPWSSYECQAAGGLFATCGGVDRSWDGGFDFVYVANTVLGCGNATAVGITDPEPGDSFMVRLSFNVSGSPLNDPSKQIHILSDDGLNISGTWTKDYTPNPVAAGSSGYADFGPATPSAPKVYNIQYEVTGAGLTCTRPLPVRAKPYFRVYGGDVRAGDSFKDTAGTCSSAASGFIKAFNQGSSGGWAGAGGEVSAYATQPIQEFASAALRSTAPLPPIGLTFANTDASTYGGNFGANICQDNYYAAASSATTDNSPIDLASEANGSYHHTAAGVATTISASGSIPNGKRVTVYADGDIVVNDNITFAGAAGGYASPADVPSIYLIAKGNIFIDSSVTQLDGMYIAQQGTIYTCSMGPATPPNGNWITSNCNSQLIVNGAFMAKQIKLLRIRNTLRDATNAEQSSGSKAAEIFNFSPEIWLTTPVAPNAGYDAIVNLPPVL